MFAILGKSLRTAQP
ncbi:hypothetical protein D039_1108, partial [Vibrio parahaemolyticus EKP-028]